MNETIQPMKNKIGARLQVALCFVLLLAPLLIGAAWGVHLDDDVYVTFRHARDLATGGEQTALKSPLYVLVLALLARLGIPLPPVGLVLSALGWGTTAIAVYCAGRAIGKPVAATVAAALVVFNPLVVSTLGSEISWVTALAWTAIASSARKRWRVQTIALALMLCLHLDLCTLALAILLVVVQWVERRRFPWRLCLVLAIIGLAWALAAARQIALPVFQFNLNLAEWGHIARQLLDESEFYCLFLPLFLCGGLTLLAAPRKTSWLGLMWAAVSVLNGGPAATAMLATAGLFLAGLGIDWIIEWIAAHHLVRLDRFALAASVALVAGAALGAAPASSLWQRYRLRPVIYQSLERQAGEWLRVHGEAAAVVLGSERAGYLADRSTLAWDGTRADPAELASLLESLAEHPPDYVVSFNSLAWDRLMQTGWFQDGYVPLQQFESPYDAASPVTVWGRRFRAFDWAELGALPLSARLPDEIFWVGYKYQPGRIQPGDTVRVTLFTQLTLPLSSRGSFQPVVRIVSPHDGAHWAQQGGATSRSVLTDSLRAGQVLAEEFVLTPPDDIPVGAYRLEASVAAHRTGIFLPVYLDGDTVPFESVVLGYVVAPWQGQLDAMTPLDANFGDQITLRGFETVDSALPGVEFEVKLYWEARRPPEDDYFVFVHLLDAGGQPIAQHDGPPVDGRYPSRAWLPGDVVPDVHRIALNPDIPAGTYRLQVGMYRWPSLERLPVWDGQGTEQPDRVIVLQTVQVQAP